MFLRSSTVVLALACWASGSARAAEPRLRTAVLGIEPADEGDPRALERTARLAKVVTDELRVRTERSHRFQLAPGTNRDLAEIKLLFDCVDEARECLTVAGLSLGAERILFGRIQRAGEEHVLTLKLLDVTAGAIEKTKHRSLRQAAALEDVQWTAALLFADVMGIPVAGSIEVRSNSPAGKVLIGGVHRASLVDHRARIEDLPEGLTQVSITAEGYARYDGQAQIKAGELVQLEASQRSMTPIALPPAETPRPESPRTYRALTWSFSVLTAAAAASWMFTGLRVQELEDQTDQKATQMGLDRSRICPAAEEQHNGEVTDLCSQGDRLAWVTNVLIGVTVGAAAATAYFAYKGYVAPPLRNAPREHERVQVLPAVERNAVGARALFRF